MIKAISDGRVSCTMVACVQHICFSAHSRKSAGESRAFFQSAPVPDFRGVKWKHLLIKSVHKNIEKPGGGADQSRRGSATLDATRILNFSKRVHFQKIYNPDTNETKLLWVVCIFRLKYLFILYVIHILQREYSFLQVNFWTCTVLYMFIKFRWLVTVPKLEHMSSE